MRRHVAYTLRLSSLGFVVLLLFSLFLVNTARADPCAILRVSLPDGTYVGLNADPWLNEGWLLNLTGPSQAFTVRINNTSASIRSYNTRVIIALNEAGYDSLQTLVVYGVTVPKSSFEYGTPRPYNLWTWPSGDVYPTWYSTYVNVGYIARKGYKDISVSVSFSDATGVRMHFDAYGSRVQGTPSSSGYITHNSLSADSTVLFQAGPPQPCPPIADFFYHPSYPNTDEVVTFNASESYDIDGYIVSYAWDFGDGTPIVVEGDPIITHAYTAFGEYSVTLTVTDDDGLTDNSTLTVSVRQHPVAAFDFAPPDPLEHEVVTFDASASTPDGGVLVSYTWDFGDGNTTTVATPIITHTYSTFGNYSITLNVTDSEGKWDTESKPITVERLPIADFVWSPPNPFVCENVTFDGSTSTPDGGVLISYAWNFGDGTPIVIESDPIANHHYTANGTFTVTLNVTDSEGRWDTESKLITVSLRKWYLTVMTDPESVTTIPGEGWYDNCTYVELTAPSYVPNENGVGGQRYEFDHWNVDGTPVSGNPISIHMDANHTATAHYTLQYYLTVTSPYGTPGGQGWYDSGSTAYATLDTGTVDCGNGTRRVFTSWNGDASGTNYAQSDPIVMNAAKTAVASWKTQYYLTVTSPYGVPAGQGWYDSGSNAYATLNTDAVDHGNGTRRMFTSWNGDASGTNYAQSNPILMNGPKTATALWKTQYYLTMSTNFGTVSPGDGWHDAGSVVSISATPPSTVSGERYVWNGWIGTGSGSYSGADNPASIIMNSPINEAASWMHQYRLTMATNYGTTTPSVGEHWYDAGSAVEISAAPPSTVAGERYLWNGWTGIGIGSYSGLNNPASVIINAPVAETASWSHEYRLTTATNFGTTTPSVGEHWFTAGSTVDISATAPSTITDERYVWNGWTGTGTGSYTGPNNSATITMNAPITQTASWTHQYYFTVASPCDSPTPTSAWFDAGTSITASVTSPWAGPAGTRCVCTGWTGTGSVPPSGTGTSVTFTINEPSSITWNWKTQYYLRVETAPSGIVTIPGEGWYDESTAVPLTAPDVAGYEFRYWDVNGTPQGNGVKTISVTMSMPRTATARYHSPTVGGSATTIELHLAPTWIGVNSILAAAFCIAALYTRKWRRRL